MGAARVMTHRQAVATTAWRDEGRVHRFHALAAVPALAGAGLGAWAYLVEETGVTGTPGALLALVGAVAVALGALLAAVPALRGGLLTLLEVLVVVGALLTALAAYFLMQFLMCGAMLLAAAVALGAAVARRRAAS